MYQQTIVKYAHKSQPWRVVWQDHVENNRASTPWRLDWSRNQIYIYTLRDFLWNNGSQSFIRNLVQQLVMRLNVDDILHLYWYWDTPVEPPCVSWPHKPHSQKNKHQLFQYNAFPTSRSLGPFYLMEKQQENTIRWLSTDIGQTFIHQLSSKPKIANLDNIILIDKDIISLTMREEC